MSQEKKKGAKDFCTLFSWRRPIWDPSLFSLLERKRLEQMFLGRADHHVPAGQLRPSDVPSKVLKTLFQKSWVDKLSQWPSLGRCQLDQSWVKLLGEGKRRTTKPKLDFVFSPEPVQETPPKRNGVTREKNGIFVVVPAPIWNGRSPEGKTLHRPGLLPDGWERKVPRSWAAG